MKKNRYANLTNAQRMTVIGSQDNVVQNHALHSFLGNPEHTDVFEKHRVGLLKDTEGFAMKNALLEVFVRYCNAPTRDAIRTASTFRDLLKRGLLGYLRAKNQQDKKAEELSTKDFSRLIDWLRTQEYAPSSCRKSYLNAQLIAKEFFKLGLAREFTIPANPFQDDDTNASGKGGSVIDNALYWKLLRACEKEIAEIIEAYRQHEKAINDPQVVRRAQERRSGCFKSIETVWAALHLRYGRDIPTLEVIRKDDTWLEECIHRDHGYERVVRPIRPSPFDMLPFVLYFTLYTVGNRGPIISLKCDDVKLVKVMDDVEKIEFNLDEPYLSLEESDRVAYKLKKPRGHKKYPRTFALEIKRQLNSWAIYKFLVEYTEPLRPLCHKMNRDNLIVFTTHEKEVRPFRGSQNGDDSDSDTTWRSAYTKFSKKHSVPTVTFRDLRYTGIDIQSEMFGGDILAQAAAGGQASARVIWRHYNGPAAKRARYERLGYVMATQERFYETRGKIDPRGAPGGEYVDAATPGWGCVDVFDSPILGERPGRMCRAFGQCPGCKHGFLPQTAYALARALQLRDEILRARTYLSAIIWNSRWADSLDKLENVWIPAFQNIPDIINEAAKLNLSPLGRLE